MEEDISCICIKCAQCCRDIPFVELSSDEIASIAEFKQLKPKQFINSKGPKIDGYFLKYKKNGDCIFLNTATSNFFCEIYEVRPKICKDYPSNYKQNEFCKLKKSKLNISKY